MDLTIIQQGRFTSNGAAKILQIRSDFDWMRVYNETVLYAAGGGNGAEFYFQRGMTYGRGVLYTKEATIGALVPTQLAANAGFTLIDSSANPVGNAVAVTGTTNATQPVTSTGATGALVTGSVVRLSNLNNVPNIAGFDFEVDNVVANTSFRMRWALATAPGGTATAGFYRQIKFDPIFYPRRRFVVNITQAAQAVVRMSVAHGYQVGQLVRFVVPADFGMVQMDGLQGTITAISTANNTITVDIDSSAFSAFAFPQAAAFPFSWAEVVPVGEDTAQALSAGVDILTDATVNQGFIGVSLAAGAASPAGQLNDVIYWVAGKSFGVDNQ